MITRLNYLLLCGFCVAACEAEKGPEQDSDTAPSTVSAIAFPAENWVASEKIFSETVLNSWGYVTTEIGDEYHAIRSKKNHGNSSEAFYARFHLAKAVFKDHAEARTTKNRIEALLKTDAGFKDYTQIIQKEATLYSVSATSNFAFLSHQPNIMDMARIHLERQAPQDAATNPKPPRPAVELKPEEG